MFRQCQRPRTGGQQIGGVDVRLQDHGHTVQRAGRTVFGERPIEVARNVEGLGIDFDDGVHGRPGLVQRFDARQERLADTFGSQQALGQVAL